MGHHFDLFLLIHTHTHTHTYVRAYICCVVFSSSNASSAGGCETCAVGSSWMARDNGAVAAPAQVQRGDVHRVVHDQELGVTDEPLRRCRFRAVCEVGHNVWHVTTCR